MTDRIELRAMAFEGRHGVLPQERTTAQPFEVDVELALDLRPAGAADDLERTVDYGAVFERVRRVVEEESFLLIEALAEAIAAAILADPVTAGRSVEGVAVRVRKMRPPIAGRLAWAGVEITRGRPR